MNVRALKRSQTQTNCSSTHGTACIVRCRLHLTRRAWPSPDASVSRVAPGLPSVPSFPQQHHRCSHACSLPAITVFTHLTTSRSTVACVILFFCILLYHVLSLHSLFCPWTHSTNRDITLPSSFCAWVASNCVQTVVRLQSRMRIKHATCRAIEPISLALSFQW